MIAAMPPAPGSSDPKLLLSAGIAAQKRSDHATARRIYHQVLRLWPDHPHALHLLGVLADAEGDPEEAVRLIRRALPALDGRANVHKVAAWLSAQAREGLRAGGADRFGFTGASARTG
jgi:Flp pilus assembly protein TadD